MTKRRRRRNTITVPVPSQPKPADPRLIRTIAKLLHKLADELLRLTAPQ